VTDAVQRLPVVLAGRCVFEREVEMTVLGARGRTLQIFHGMADLHA